MSNIYAAIEIGTTRTVLAVGEAEKGGRLRMTAHAEIPSIGVRKSQVLDISQTTQSIRSVLKQIVRNQNEKDNSSLTIGHALLVVSGQHVQVTPIKGTTSIGRDKVRDEDISEVIRSSRSIPLAKGRELLDLADQDFVIDNRGGISSPKGMSGSILQLNTLQIHADENRINDARTAADDARLEISEPIFAATCAADAVLDETEKREGVLVLDFGGGSTGYAAYSDGYLVDAGVFGVGGDHITNDIAHAFQTTQAQAETLKRNNASAVLSPEENATSRVGLPGSSALMDGRTISRRALDTVVNARMRELLKIIRARLEERDLVNRLKSVVITGGGAALKDLDQLIARELGMGIVRPGRPVNIDGLEAEPGNEAFAAIAGALIYAHRNCEDKSFFSGIFGRIFK